MVSYNAVQASNALLRGATSHRIAVFIGGTSGIGKSTIEALVASGASSKIYIIGRKSAEQRTRDFIKNMRSVNDRAEVIWAEAEVERLAETRRVCNDIKGRESRIDLLFMTAGYAPFGSRRETIDGLEVTQSLEYYTRILFTLLLAPLLTNSDTPRVVSVLAGGKEKLIDMQDLDLKKPENFGGLKAQAHYAAMNTATMEKLARNYPGITYIHSFPGWVFTGNHRRGAENTSIAARLVWPIADSVIKLFSLSNDESGQRHLFESTSSVFGGRGVVSADGQPNLNSWGVSGENGLFLLGDKFNSAINEGVMKKLLETGQAEIWEHTQKVLAPYM